MATIKPTLKDPMSPQSEKFEKNFNKTMISTAPNINLNEVDGMLNEKEQSLKKKIFSLAKMESLVFADPKLSAVYDGMAENGEEKYGYHYNETIMNMLFNDYVLNSPKYLQQYKMAIPKEKKRRDKSGINQLKKAGMKKSQSGLSKLAPSKIDESDEEVTKVVFLINPTDPDVFAYFPDLNYDRTGKYKTGYSHIGQHSAIDPNYAKESRAATPEEYQNLNVELEGQGYVLDVLNTMQESTSAGSAGGAAGYTGYAGPSAWAKTGDLSGDFKGKKKSTDPKAKPIKTGFALGESNYLTDSSGFEKYISMLNEETDADFISRNGSNTYGSVDNMNPENQKIIKNDIQNRKFNNNSNIKDSIALDEDYSISNPEPMKEIGWISLPKYKYGGLGVFEISDNDEFGKRSGAEYIMASAYEFEYRIVSDGNNKYHIENNPKFWRRYISLDQESKKVLYLDDNEKFKVLGKYNDITIDPNKRWTYESDTEKFWSEIEKLKNEGASFEFNGEPIFDKEDKIKEETQTMIGDNGTSMSNKAQASNDQGGEVPMGMQNSGGMNEEDTKLFEEINNELNAFSVHQAKLKQMSEDRKTPSQIINDRVTGDNPKNFKKDLQHSGTKDTIDVEKELMWADQQTEIGKDPQKLAADIEKLEMKTADMKGKEALKNVGNSTNDKGDEIPKRNLTSDEQKEVDLYRNGQHSWVYDNEPDERFEERMKADMGDKVYEMRQKQLEFKGKAPMYNKDPQPVEDTTAKKVQFDKEQTEWNERMGIDNEKSLKESFITGRYHDGLNKSRLLEFSLNEVTKLTTPSGTARQTNLFELDFTGLGNTYQSKTVDRKVIVNEGIVNAISQNKFYTDGKKVFAIKNPVQNLSEGEIKSKVVVNEQIDKMKHLLGYKPQTFVNTKNVKNNRGF